MSFGDGGPSDADLNAENTLICPSCGFQNAAGQNFCGSCGKQLNPDALMSIVAPGVGTQAAEQIPAGKPPVAPQPPADVAVAQQPANATGQTPETVFDPLAYPDEFALASVEMMNYVQLTSTLGGEAQAETFRNDCIGWVEERVTIANGVIESVRNNILFISFPREATVEDSVRVAIGVVQQILDEPFEIQGMALKVRVGLDVEKSAERKPMTSATERSLATPGSAVVSERIYRMIERQYNVEPIGPLKVGDRMLTFYRVLSPHKAVIPQEDILSDPKPVQERLAARPEPTPMPVPEQQPATTPQPRLNPTPPATERIIQEPLVSAKHSVDLPEEPGVEPLPLYSSEELANPEALSVPEIAPEPLPPPMPESVPTEAPAPEPVPEPLPEPKADATAFGGNATATPEDLAGAVPGSIPGVDPALMKSIGIDPGLLSGDAPDLSQPMNVTGEAAPMGELPVQGGELTGAANDTAGSGDTLHRVDESLRLPSGYAPPLYGSTQARRDGSERYEDVVGSLITELKNFVSQDSARGQVISLVGPDGVGKSYIANNLILKELIPDPQKPGLIWAFGHNYHSTGREQQMPLYYWYEMLSNFVGALLEGVDREELRTRVSQIMNQAYQGEVAEETVDFFCDMLSVNPLEPVSAETLNRLGNLEHHIADFLSRLAVHMPVLMLVEDLDRADVASQDVLARLLNHGLLKNRICVILTYSDDYYPEGDLAKALQNHPHREYRVNHLSRDEIANWMASGPFAGTLDQLSADQVESLMTYSKGSTMYLMEAVSYLTVSGSLLADQKTGKLVPAKEIGSDPLMLPATVEEMIQYRVAKLDDESRYVLQVASVLGERFALGILLDLCEMQPEKMQQVLEFLSIQQFIIGDFMTGQFRHELVWEQVYNSMEPQVRVDMHRLISEYLEDKTQNGVSVNPALIAYHATCGQMLNRASQYWNMAGVYCAQVGSLVGLNMAFSRAMAMLPEAYGDNPEQLKDMECRLRENMGLLNLDEAPDFSVSVMEPVAEHYESRGDTAKMIEALGYLATGHEGIGNIHVALELRDRVLEHISKEQFPQEYATLQVAKLEYLYRLGRLQKAADLFATEIEPIAQVHMAQDPFYYDVYLNARLIQAEIALLQCDMSAFTIIDETLKQAQERGMVELAVLLKLARTKAFLYKGNYAGCQRSLQSTLQEIENLENNEPFVADWGLLAMMYHCELGEWSEANELALHSMFQAEKAREHLTWITINAYGGAIAMGENRVTDARHILEAMATESSERRFATSAFICWRYLTDVYMALDDVEQALDVASKALDIAHKDEVNHVREIYLLGVKKARLLLHTGDVKGAGELLQAQWPLVKQTGLLPLIAETASAIGELSKRMAEQSADSVMGLKYQERADSFFDIARSQWMQMKNGFEAQRVAERAAKP